MTHNDSETSNNKRDIPYRDSKKTIQKVNVNVCCKDPEKKKGNKRNNYDNVEFRFDERTPAAPVPIPPAPAAPVPLLEVGFDELNPGDRVWLNGIVSLNNNNNVFSTVTLTITRTPVGGAAQTIYTQVFEIDNEGDDDQGQVPFSHVDTLTAQIFNARYRVLITVGNPNLTAQGTNTLTAIRFIQ